MPLPPLLNKLDISLPMAVWLAHDEYDNGGKKFPGQQVYSATGLIKPVKQLILANRVPEHLQQYDVQDLIASSLGTAVHDSVEKAWTAPRKALRRLGYTDEQIDLIRINPEPGQLQKGEVPVYLEQRCFKELDPQTVISGKFDQVFNGTLHDLKTTSAWTWKYETKEEDYAFQGSVYRWLAPDKITGSKVHIQFLFTDWQKGLAERDPEYPQKRLERRAYDLLSPELIEDMIRNKVTNIRKYWNANEADMPRCTDKELWRSDPKYSYFSDPAKVNVEGAKPQKNFTNYASAALHQSTKGKGGIKTVPGKVKACSYCPAFPVCAQKDEYLGDHNRDD